MGCKQRGFCGQRAFDHTTGQGYVKSQRGHYHDGIFTKRNKFNLLLHETFGGGFSPPAVAKINRLARKAQRSGVDRTAYPPHSRLSFVSHHAERISIASVKGVNRAILDRRAKLASELSRRARRGPLPEAGDRIRKNMCARHRDKREDESCVHTPLAPAMGVGPASGCDSIYTLHLTLRSVRGSFHCIASKRLHSCSCSPPRGSVLVPSQLSTWVIGYGVSLAGPAGQPGRHSGRPSSARPRTRCR